MNSDVMPPHGGCGLVNRIVPVDDVESFVQRARELKGFTSSDGDLSAFYRIADGTLSPLEGPMDRNEFYQVLENETVERNGKLYAWTIPIAFPVRNEEGRSFGVGETVAVRDERGVIVGTLEISDIYHFDKAKYNKAVYGTERQDHPGRQPARVERGQHAQQPIVAVDAGRQDQVPDVRQEILVGQRHSLGQALRAAGKQDHGGGGDPCTAQGRPPQPGLQRRFDLRPQRYLLAHILQEQQAVRQIAQVDALGLKSRDQGARCQNVVTVHQFQGIPDVSHPGRPVHHHGRLAGEQRREEQDIGTHAGR